MTQVKSYYKFVVELIAVGRLDEGREWAFASRVVLLATRQAKGCKQRWVVPLLTPLAPSHEKLLTLVIDYSLALGTSRGSK